MGSARCRHQRAGTGPVNRETEWPSCLIGTTVAGTVSIGRAISRSDCRAGVEDAVGVERPLDPLVELHRLGPELARQPGPFQPADAVFAGDGAAEPDARSMISPNAFWRARHRRVGGSYTISGWVLPSPACAITEIIRSWFAAILPPRRPDRRGRAAGRRRPRAAVSPWPRPRGSRIGARPRTPHPRPGRTVENTSFAPCSVNTLAMNSASSTPEGPRSSVAATIIAAAFRSRPIRSLSSTALIAAESMNSSIDGRILPVIVTTAPAAASHRVERRDHRARDVLRRQQPQGHLGDHPERALAADEQLGQRKPGDILQARAAEAHHGPVGQHHLKAQHVVGGDAVFHAAQPAGVGGDVAADAADLERRRIRRIPQPVLGDGLLHLGVEQPGLRDGGARHRVDGDVPHLLRAQHDAAVEGGRAAGQPGAHAAGTTAILLAVAQRITVCTSSVRRGRTTASGVRRSGRRHGLAGRTPGCRGR